MTRKQLKIPVLVLPHQCCPWSLILFVVFMDRISGGSCGEVGVWFEKRRVLFLLFYRWVGSVDILEPWPSACSESTECLMAGMRVSSSRSETMVLYRRKRKCSLGVWDESLSQEDDSSIGQSCSWVTVGWSRRWTNKSRLYAVMTWPKTLNWHYVTWT